MKKLLIVLAILLSFSLPVYAQSEGGDSASPATSITIGLEDALVGILISVIGVALFVLVRKGRELRTLNPELTKVIFAIGDVVVTIIPGSRDNDFWNWLKAKIEAGEEITFEELRDELNDANK